VTMAGSESGDLAFFENFLIRKILILLALIAGVQLIYSFCYPHYSSSVCSCDLRFGVSNFEVRQTCLRNTAKC
jgi:hypothetical protein